MMQSLQKGGSVLPAMLLGLSVATFLTANSSVHQQTSLVDSHTSTCAHRSSKVYACFAHYVLLLLCCCTCCVLSADKQWQATWAGVPRPSETEQ
jgi:hypothetical protein